MLRLVLLAAIVSFGSMNGAPSASAALPAADALAERPSPAPTFADLASLEYRTAEILAADVAGAQDEPTPPQQDRELAAGEQFSSAGTRIERFGAEGTWQFNIFASGAWGESGFDSDDNRHVSSAGGGVGVDYFLGDDFSIGAQLVGLSFVQDGPETWGAGVEVLLRWHFVSEDTWSMYVDGGAGFLKTSDDVPPHGSNYNFTPQAGVGFTIEIGGRARAMTGIRWHHISNADSADSNPGLDSVMIYGGITVPF